MKAKNKNTRFLDFIEMTEEQRKEIEEEVNRLYFPPDDSCQGKEANDVRESGAASSRRQGNISEKTLSQSVDSKDVEHKQTGKRPANLRTMKDGSDVSHDGVHDSKDGKEKCAGSLGTSTEEGSLDVEFCTEEAVEGLENSKRFKSDKMEEIKAICRSLRSAGIPRRKLRVLNEDWRALLQEFRARFPNFDSVVRALEEQFALNALGDGRVAFRPLLLVGPPGVGKTHFARSLAERLRLPFIKMDFASIQTGSGLSGSEAFWANSRHGEIFNILYKSKFINPIVIVDELDKAGHSQYQYDPFGPLHTLLEATSAVEFEDLSLPGLKINASHINWIFTANDLSSIPAPVRNRLSVRLVREPTKSEIRIIAREMYKDFINTSHWGSAFCETLGDDVVDTLSAMPPRSLAKCLYHAFGRAALEGVREIRPSHLVDAVNADSAFERRAGF